MKSQTLRTNNLVIIEFSEKSLSQGSLSFSSSSELVQAREDKSETPSIAKITSKACWELMVAAIFSTAHWSANSWFCFANFSTLK